MVALATLVLTVLLYVVVPKGFFPVQDTGVILGISEAPADGLVPRDGRPAAGARARDPEGPGGGEPLVVHRHRRHEHDHEQRAHPDQPEAARGARGERREIIRRLQPELARVEGITLFMQPVQDLTVEDRVSRTQYQYSLEDPDAGELALWAPRFVKRLQAAAASCATSRATSRPRGWPRASSSTATTASRLGITPQMLDDALYDAFGQRQVSTMFTELNQYRVVLEAAARLPAAAGGPGQRLPAHRAAAERCRSPPSRASRSATRRSPSTTRASSPWSRSPSTSPRAPRWATP